MAVASPCTERKSNSLAAVEALRHSVSHNTIDNKIKENTRTVRRSRSSFDFKI